MKFSRTIALGLSISAAILLAGAGTADAQKQRVIEIGRGGPTGVYFAAGNAICKAVKAKVKPFKSKGQMMGLRCSAPSTDGSIFNLEKIREGVIDFGIAQSDWQYHAYNRTSKSRVRSSAIFGSFSLSAPSRSSLSCGWALIFADGPI